MMASGSTFETAAVALGVEEQLSAPFNCILNGWVDRGRLTQTGLAVAHKAMKPTPWEITVLPPAKRSTDR